MRCNIDFCKSFQGARPGPSASGEDKGTQGIPGPGTSVAFHISVSGENESR